MSDSEIPSIITRPFPNAVTYDLSTPNQVTITLPLKSIWSSGLHWHETHTEYLRLVKGKIRVRLGDETSIIHASPQAIEIRIDRKVWHEWSRVPPDNEDGSGEEDDEDVVVIERTDPADGAKAIFFWNLNGVILKAQRSVKPSLLPPWLFGVLMECWVTLNLFTIFATLDNVPVLLGVRDGMLKRRRSSVVAVHSWTDWLLMWVEWTWAHATLKVALTVARLVGAEPVSKEFTPLREYNDWMALNRDKKKGL
ncbi:Cupin, RmlC-type [Podospora didyma]|uniref:Cupin, RmlC-type n=1 Tax=Podospora didyma TaxID=330526 RepID=A0AAE0KDF7_9PEZI|nr:Cupin, RmlC-type [Podospora didyma]